MLELASATNYKYSNYQNPTPMSFFSKHQKNP